MAKKQCPHCGAEYEDTGISTLCSTCQKPLDETPDAAVGSRTVTVSTSERAPCPSCGEPLYESEATCWKCGTAQTRGPVAATPPRPEPAPPPVSEPQDGPPPPPPLGAGAPVAPPPSPLTPEGDDAVDAANRKGTAALILGIISLVMMPIVCCGCGAFMGIVPSAFAIWLGSTARQEGASGQATAGMIMGIIAACIYLVVGILGIVAMFL